MPPPEASLNPDFFARDARVVACDLLGKVLCHNLDGAWLCAAIVETEAYFLWDKASHASLGFTHKRRALFSAPGTIYMYYARGGDSFNISCQGEGNAVLLKAGIPWQITGQEKGRVHANWLSQDNSSPMMRKMQQLNPLPGGRVRENRRLCAGQTLLCRALGLKVPTYDGGSFGNNLRLIDGGNFPESILRTTRLGIPPGRDGHLPFRYVWAAHGGSATQNPQRRGSIAERDYSELKRPQSKNWADVLDLSTGE